MSCHTWSNYQGILKHGHTSWHKNLVEDRRCRKGWTSKECTDQMEQCIDGNIGFPLRDDPCHPLDYPRLTNHRLPHENDVIS